MKHRTLNIAGGDLAEFLRNLREDWDITQGELEADDGPNRCCDACGHYDTCAVNKMEERNE